MQNKEKATEDKKENKVWPCIHAFLEEMFPDYFEDMRQLKEREDRWRAAHPDGVAI